MPEINLTAGTLPPPACYASEQDRLDAYAEAIIAQYSAPPEWSAGAFPPADLSLYWLRLDSNQNPVEVLKYNTASGGWARVQTQFTYGVGGGVANAYTIALTPTSPGANQAYRTGVCYAFVANLSNTGATTVDVDTRGVKAITKFGTTPLVAGDMVSGQMCVVVYDGTRFQLLNPGLNIGTANIAPGIDRQFLRTNATPATVWESGYITPVASYLAIPAAGGTASFSHGMSVLPLSWSIGIICITNDTAGAGDSQYEVGDFIPGDDLLFSTSESIFTTYANSNVIAMVRFNGAFSIYVRKKNSGDLGLIQEAKWKVMARAIR
jgi:hypothetical protein